LHLIEKPVIIEADTTWKLSQISLVNCPTNSPVPQNSPGVVSKILEPTDFAFRKSIRVLSTEFLPSVATNLEAWNGERLDPETLYMLRSSNSDDR
jgi:hypothetical protein